MVEVGSIRVGDRFRVIAEHPGASNVKCNGFLSVGDIIEAAELRPEFRGHYRDWVGITAISSLYGRILFYKLDYNTSEFNAILGVIPLDKVEFLNEIPVCTCEIRVLMIKGCQCQAISYERRFSS